MPSALCLVLGTRGDVQPLAILATALAQHPQWNSCTLVTHVAHRSWLKELLWDSPVRAVWLQAPPAAEWSQRDATGKKRRRDCADGQQPLGLGPYRDELVRVVEKEFSISFNGGQHAGPARSTGLPEVCIFNFLCLEGYHIGEALGSKLVVASPYQVPYGCPSAFQRRFQSAFPDLYDVISESTAPSQLTESREPKATEIYHSAEANGTAWVDVEHWMWPLFTERWGPWRAQRLGLPPVPLTDHADRPHSPATAAPLVLYGYSEVIVPCPGYWPAHFKACGFWTSKQSGPDEPLLPQRLPAAEAKVLERCLDGFQGTERPVLIDFGGMGAMGLIEDPDTAAKALVLALQRVRRSGILLSGGWEPLVTAVRRVQSTTVDSGGGICCLPSFPHGDLMRGCAAILHHGGSGTTAAALSAGLPQIICPFQFDQFFWAERMSWLGLAPEPLRKDLIFSNETYTPEERASYVQGVLESALTPEARSAAQDIAKELDVADAASGGGCAVAVSAILEYELRHKVQQTSQPHEAEQGTVSGHMAPNAGDASGSGRELFGEFSQEVALQGLPPGVLFRCFGLEEAFQIHEEVFLDCVYLQHGLSVSPGDTIVDVGANIGLFSAFVLLGPLPATSKSILDSWRGPPARILAIEPVPPVAQALRDNILSLRHHGLILSEQVEILEVAAGRSECPKNQRFTFYPRMAGNSTMHPTEKALQYWKMSSGLRDMCFSDQLQFNCSLRPLSAILQERGIQQVDLLKIDVEGSELDVLEGIDNKTWPGVRQIVVEVHNHNNRLSDVKALLQYHGFKTITRNGLCKSPQPDSSGKAACPEDGASYMVYGLRSEL